MKKYRLARNKYGYYKIQKLIKTSMFGMKSDKWKDVKGVQMYAKAPFEVMKFKTKASALECIKNLKRKDKRNNDNWKYEKKIR